MLEADLSDIHKVRHGTLRVNEPSGNSRIAALVESEILKIHVVVPVDVPRDAHPDASARTPPVFGRFRARTPGWLANSTGTHVETVTIRRAVTE